jgi:hypothetical protein
MEIPVKSKKAVFVKYFSSRPDGLRNRIYQKKQKQISEFSKAEYSDS